MSYKILNLNMSVGPSLGIDFEAKDEYDNFVLENITMPCMGSLSLEAVCFQGNVKEKENFFKVIYNITECLFKANIQRRKYCLEEKCLINDHLVQSKKDYPNSSSDIRLKPVELMGYVDGVLSNLKASLDLFVKVLNQFFGIKLHGWHKKKNKDGKLISGLDIIKKLKALDDDKYKVYLPSLIEFIDINKDWITYLVELRDASHHGGGIKNISDISYSQKNKTILAPQIIHPDSNSESLNQFLNSTLEHFNMFICSLLMLSIQTKVPFAILKRTTDQNGTVFYGWEISVPVVNE